MKPETLVAVLRERARVIRAFADRKHEYAIADAFNSLADDIEEATKAEEVEL